jgi:hypothetical protein
MNARNKSFLKSYALRHLKLIIFKSEFQRKDNLEISAAQDDCSLYRD